MLDFKVIAADKDFGSAREQIDERSYVVVATMGNRDEEGLLAVIGTRPKYLGLVASKKKSEALFEYVREKGASDEDIAVITCPAGIEIGSETLAEIGLSVAAELTSIRRKGSDQPVMRPEAAATAIDSGRQPDAAATAIDPICGMTVDVENAQYTSVADGQTIYFCCLRCKETFDRPPVTQIGRR
jgi:xanthine dehydrogenase accessory factor